MTWLYIATALLTGVLIGLGISEYLHRLLRREAKALKIEARGLIDTNEELRERVEDLIDGRFRMLKELWELRAFKAKRDQPRVQGRFAKREGVL